MKDTLILYHKGCRDGLGAAWAAWKHFGWNGAKYRSIRFSAEPGAAPEGWEDENRAGREVFMLDVLPENERFVQTLAGLHDLVVLDHHETARDSYGDMAGMDYRYAEDRSGAVMAWECFHPGESVPRLLEYIQDRDLWEHDLPHTEAVNAVIRSHPMHFQVLDELRHRIDNDFETVVAEGDALLRHQEQQVDYLASNPVKSTDKEGRRFVSVNAKCYVSDLGHRLLDEYPNADYASIWHLRAPGTVKVSLRGREDGPHVGRIAEEHGGGGHAEAAGFVLENARIELG